MGMGGINYQFHSFFLNFFLLTQTIKMARVKVVPIDALYQPLKLNHYLRW